MKRITTLFIVTLFLVFIAQSSFGADPVLIAFNSRIPSSGNNCSGVEALDLLGTGSEWVESMECTGVSMVAGWPGLRLSGVPGSADGASMKIVFRKDEVIKALRIRLLGAGLESSPAKIALKVNGKDLNTPDIPVRSSLPGSVVALDEALNESTQNVLAWSSSDLIDPAEALKEIEITVLPVDGETNRIQIVGLRIFNSGTEVIPDISSTVESVKQEPVAEYEYFDLYGRRLSGKPDRGIFIRRAERKSDKIIVR